MNLRNGQSARPAIRQSASLSTCLSVIPPLGPAAPPSFSRSASLARRWCANLSICLPVKPPFRQSVNVSSCHAVIRQSALLSICEFVHPSIRQPPSLSTCPCDNLSRCPPVNLRIRRAANASIRQPPAPLKRQTLNLRSGQSVNVYVSRFPISQSLRP